MRLRYFLFTERFIYLYYCFKRLAPLYLTNFEVLVEIFVNLLPRYDSRYSSVFCFSSQSEKESYCLKFCIRGFTIPMQKNAANLLSSSTNHNLTDLINVCVFFPRSFPILISWNIRAVTRSSSFAFCQCEPKS